MRPQDIEKIANSVVGAFSQPSRASAGCGAISSTQEYDCSTGYYCQSEAGYECGGQASFDCTMESFSCVDGFNCPSSFDCTSAYSA